MKLTVMLPAELKKNMSLITKIIGLVFTVIVVISGWASIINSIVLKYDLPDSTTSSIVLGGIVMTIFNIYWIWSIVTKSKESQKES